MSLCTEVGRWVDEYIEQPLEQVFQTTKQQCTETRRQIETWRQQQEQRCREQECNWWCLCCNKWFCWLVTVLVRVVEWIVETVCHLVVEIVRVIVMVLVKVARWIVEAIVCIVERFCAYLYFLAGVALIGVLITGVLNAAAVVLPGGIALLAGTIIATFGALLLALVLCEPSVCRLLGLVFWALKWAVVIGMILVVVLLNAAPAFVVVLYGGTAGALQWLLVRRGCRIPAMLSWP